MACPFCIFICHHLGNKWYPSYISFICKEKVFLHKKVWEWEATYESRRVNPATSFEASFPLPSLWRPQFWRGVWTWSLSVDSRLSASWHSASMKNLHVIIIESKWTPVLSHNTLTLVPMPRPAPAFWQWSGVGSGYPVTPWLMEPGHLEPHRAGEGGLVRELECVT